MIWSQFSCSEQSTKEIYCIYGKKSRQNKAQALISEGKNKLERSRKQNKSPKNHDRNKEPALQRARKHLYQNLNGSIEYDILLYQFGVHQIICQLSLFLPLPLIPVKDVPLSFTLLLKTSFIWLPGLFSPLQPHCPLSPHKAQRTSTECQFSSTSRGISGEGNTYLMTSPTGSFSDSAFNLSGYKCRDRKGPIPAYSWALTAI